MVVLSGHGIGRGEGLEQELSEGDVVLVPAGEKHQFQGGEGGLKTITFYGPVAYPDEA